MSNTIKVRRGPLATIPTLEAGEFGFTTDTSALYIGTGVANVLLSINGESPDSAKLGGQLPAYYENVATNISVVEAPTLVTIQSSTGSNDSIAAANATNAGVMTKAMYDEHVLNNAKVSDINHNVSTNLSIGTKTTTTVDINSSDGDNATIPAATTSLAGLMTDAQFNKLAGIAAGAQVNVGTNISWTAGTTAGPRCNSSTGSDAVIPVASATASGAVTTGTQTFAGTKTFSSTITGNISGNAGGSSASCTGNAATASQLYINNDDTGDTNCPILFTATTTAGNKAVYEDSAVYIDNTANNIHATGFTGELTGNASTVTNGVYTTRTISTTAPLTGGGNLSVNRTIAIPAATASVNGYATSTQITKLDGIAAGAKVGDVVGPASSVANRIVTFNGITGKLIQDSGALISDAAGNSTVVKRTSAGYINANYFNTSAAASAAAATNYFFGSGDGYIRKKTLANTKTEIVTAAAVSTAGAVMKSSDSTLAAGVQLTVDDHKVLTGKTTAVAADMCVSNVVFQTSATLPTASLFTKGTIILVHEA